MYLIQYQVRWHAQLWWDSVDNDSVVVEKLFQPIAPVSTQ